MALKFAYSESTAEELQREIDARNKDGRSVVPASNKKADLVAALLADDKASEAAPVSTKTLAAPETGMGDYRPNVGGWDPKDRALYGDAYRKKGTPHPDPDLARRGLTIKLQGDDETYFLRVIEDDPRGNTHHLKNSDHTWKGSEGSFRESFEKVADAALV